MFIQGTAPLVRNCVTLKKKKRIGNTYNVSIVECAWPTMAKSRCKQMNLVQQLTANVGKQWAIDFIR